MYVGVSSTGIYCRPICPARTPKFENCSFFGSAAAAQDAGFRPCLRCRPEIAPDLASWRGTSNTVSRALALIAEGALDGAENNVEKLAARLGLGERQLRRLFFQHLGASPVSVAQTRRVLFAKQLIHDTQMPMTEVAAAAGFSSVRRFNETFLHLFHRPPRALRRKSAPREEEKEIILRLSYRAPYDWENMLAFLRARAIPGVEVLEAGRYLRTVEVDGAVGSIAVTHLPKQQSLGVSIRFPNVKALPGIVARVRRQFDLGADIETIDQHLSLAYGLLAVGMDLRLPHVQSSVNKSVSLLRAGWRASWSNCTAVLCPRRFGFTPRCRMYFLLPGDWLRLPPSGWVCLRRGWPRSRQSQRRPWQIPISFARSAVSMKRSRVLKPSAASVNGRHSTSLFAPFARWTHFLRQTSDC
jgi:methylphosphotriester-DNA--protein-cysteine methyltransferase